MRLRLPTASYLVVLAAACGGDNGSPAPSAAPAAQPSPAPAIQTPPAVPAPAAAAAGGEVKLDQSLVKQQFGSEPMGPTPPRKSKARVDLGRKLYHDQRLSKGGDVSCASCHNLDTWGQDNKATSAGTGGLATKRSTPTTLNAARQWKQFWDYRSESIEDQAKQHLLGPEIGLSDEAQVVSILKGIPEYEADFKAAFPKDEDPFTADNVALALGAFQRTLETRSRFDEYLDGNDAALTTDEKAGLKTFIEVAGCTTCHVTRLVGGNQLQKLGLVMPVQTADQGRYEFSKNEGEKGFWKVPTLLNIEHTAPYYHDGSKATLEEAVKDMAKIQLGRTLSDDQVKSIVTFLKALSGKLVEK